MPAAADFERISNPPQCELACVLGHDKAGRERFELARELYTPYPLSRRVLSTTQPPPRTGLGVVRFYPSRAPFILSTAWRHQEGQARPRCRVPAARWHSEPRADRGASSGTRSP